MTRGFLARGAVWVSRTEGSRRKLCNGKNWLSLSLRNRTRFVYTRRLATYQDFFAVPTSLAA